MHNKLKAVLLVLVSVGALFQSVLAQTLPDKLYIAIAPTHAPYTSMNENGEFSGYEIDVLRIACARLKVECQIEGVEWAKIIANVRFSKYHLLAGGMGITANRKRMLIFSRPTVESDTTSFASIKGSAASQLLREIKVDDVNTIQTLVAKTLPSMKIGTISGVNQSHMGNYFGKSVVVYKTTADLINALVSDEVQAIYSDNESLKNEAKKNSAIQVIDNGIKPPSDGVAFASIEKHRAIIDAFNNVLEEMINEGELKKIAKPWIDPEIVP